MKNQRQPSKIQLKWKQHLEDFQTSGLSGAAFCRDRSLNYKSFSFWKAKLGETKSTGFAKVKSKPSPAHRFESAHRLKFPNGLTLEMKSLPDLQWLRELGGVK